MSSFGGVPLDLTDSNIDYSISSSNKCLQRVPGFAFVIARRDSLQQIRHRPRSISLDLRGQWECLQQNGQFRFTPPTHVMLAFRQALRELDQESGVAKRAARYRENQRALVAGMRKLGFRIFVPPNLQSHIITAFLYPHHSRFEFAEFYQRLSNCERLIYPGKLATVDCFRVGNIGDLHLNDMAQLLDAIESTLGEMQIEI